MLDDVTEPLLLQLSFLGKPMATLGLRPTDGAHALDFDPTFLAEGHDLSPFLLPIEDMRIPRIFRQGDSPFAGGLPGLIADSLPDAWGERMLMAEVPGVKTILGKLAAIGSRGPGAITFEPVIGRGNDAAAVRSNLASLACEAAKIYATAKPIRPSKVDAALAHGGSSLGGAYPKISAHLLLTESSLDLTDVLIGGSPPLGYIPSIVKFSAVNDEGGGAVEFAFLQMAAEAGIRVPRSSLIFDGERRHFAVERFDRFIQRDGAVGRRHVHSLSGILHRRASATENPLDYEDFMRVSRALAGSKGALECYRRAVFNILATNRDDHGRNHAFVYNDQTRTWDLAPAYDLNPSVANVLIGLTWMASGRIPTDFEELVRFAEIGGISARVAREIFAEVEAAIFGNWPRLASKAGVPRETHDAWFRNMQTQNQALRESAARKAKVRRGARSR